MKFGDHIYFQCIYTNVMEWKFRNKYTNININVYLNKSLSITNYFRYSFIKLSRRLILL